MKNVFIFLLLTVFISCSKDENSADKFLGTQDVTITLNSKSYPMKGGEYYNSQNESNCEITTIEMDLNSSARFKFTLENSAFFEKFSFTFSNAFGDVGLPVGQIIEKPYFFAYSLTLANGGDSYIEGGFGQNNYADTNIENVSLKINERVSNGVEKIVDGVRKDYPKEKITGVLNLRFKDNAGESQVLKMDFDLEGDNIVLERVETSTTTGGDGNDGSGGDGNCSNLTYNGPTEGQAAQWCANAQILQCIDDSSPEYKYQCQIIKDYDVNCSYCN